MRADSRNIADVICIGAQKAGTSWLHYALQGHPGLYAFPNASPVTSTNKEAHFWDWNRALGIDWYRELLRPPSPDRLSMDFTPEYALMSDSEIEECKLLSPDARILYLIRDPVARAVSALRMYAKLDEHVGSIRADDQFLSWIAKHHILEHSRYTNNLARWRKHYQSMLIVDYGDICADPEGVRDKVVKFLGLPSRLEDKAADRRYRRRSSRRIWASNRIRIEKDVVEFLEARLGAERDLVRQQLGIEPKRSWRERIGQFVSETGGAWRWTF